MVKAVAGTENCTLPVFTGGHPCTHSTGEARWDTAALWPLSHPSLTCFSYAGTAYVYMPSFPQETELEPCCLIITVLIPLFACSLTTCWRNLSQCIKVQRCVSQRQRREADSDAVEGIADASHHLQLCKQCTRGLLDMHCPLHQVPSEPGVSPPGRGWGVRRRGQRGQSTPPHAKLALISCAAQRAMTPKQQFYSKGEDPQGAWAVLQGWYEWCSGHVWGVQLAIRRNKLPIQYGVQRLPEEEEQFSYSCKSSCLLPSPPPLLHVLPSIPSLNRSTSLSQT